MSDKTHEGYSEALHPRVQERSGEDWREYPLCTTAHNFNSPNLL